MSEVPQDHPQSITPPSEDANDAIGHVNTEIPSCKCNPNREARRKLIVMFDGTSNKFGEKNTNVVELYHRIQKSDNQLTYYNSGIGTYAKPSWRSLTYLKMVVGNKIDLAIAWNFEKIVMGGYRWLSENYREGDQIFLFGFSRGAYQVRVLAGMVETVGLIHPGNQEQIPFAYQVYADTIATGMVDDLHSKRAGGHTDDAKVIPTEKGIYQSHTDLPATLPASPTKALPPLPNDFHMPLNKVQRHIEKTSFRIGKMLGTSRHTSEKYIKRARYFKITFCREVKVHFVGVWDTVSSVGIHRSKALPLVHHIDHICFFRHALALDELRVKFLPEYAHGGISMDQSRDYREIPKSVQSSTGTTGDSPHKVRGRWDKATTPPHLKEVWFSGSHSDVGGGIEFNPELDLGSPPCLWMANEARIVGLGLKPPRGERRWRKFRELPPSKSLRGMWWFLECLPLTRLAYKDAEDTTNAWHLGRGRVVKPGQLIHVSVAFKDPDYKPKAVLPGDWRWDDIIDTQSRLTKVRNDLTDILEMDLSGFEVGTLIQILRTGAGDANPVNCLRRLSILAANEVGTQEILSVDKGCETLVMFLGTPNPEAQFASATVLHSMLGHRTSFLDRDQILDISRLLRNLVIERRDERVQAAALGLLGKLEDNAYSDKEVRHKMGDFRRDILNSNVMQTIANGLMREEPQVQAFLAEGLGWLGRVDGIPGAGVIDAIRSLAAVLNKTQDDEVQASGALALYKLAAHDLRSVILQTDAIRSLALMGRSENSKVQLRAARALHALATYGKLPIAALNKEALSSFVAMLGSQDDDVRVSGAKALCTVAVQAKIPSAILDDANNALESMVESEEIPVRFSAARALFKLNPNPDVLSDRAQKSILAYQDAHVQMKEKYRGRNRR